VWYEITGAIVLMILGLKAGRQAGRLAS